MTFKPRTSGIFTAIKTAAILCLLLFRVTCGNNFIPFLYLAVFLCSFLCTPVVSVFYFIFYFFDFASLNLAGMSPFILFDRFSTAPISKTNHVSLAWEWNKIWGWGNAPELNLKWVVVCSSSKWLWRCSNVHVHVYNCTKAGSVSKL